MMEENIKDLNILIVDDNVDNLVFLEQLFRRKGYRKIMTIADSRNVLPYIGKADPDIILLDIMMPYIDGYEILRSIRGLMDSSVFLPVVVLTAVTDRKAREQTLKDGATDFLTKPLDAVEVILRVGNLLRTRYMYKQHLEYSKLLESAVLHRTRELAANNQALEKVNQVLDETNIEIADRLAEAAEYRDDATGKHTFRVGAISALIAAELGFSNDFVELVDKAARLHDLGKIGIPDAILLKPGKLTEEEFDVMRQHCVIGAKVLSGGHSELLEMAERIALSHHEHWDGNGYPNGLKAKAIPIEARIVSVVDVFDALTHPRPYKDAWTQQDAVDYITSHKDRQFDEKVVDAFLSVLEKKSGEIDFIDMNVGPEHRQDEE